MESNQTLAQNIDVLLRAYPCLNFQPTEFVPSASNNNPCGAFRFRAYAVIGDQTYSLQHEIDANVVRQFSSLDALAEVLVDIFAGLFARILAKKIGRKE